MPRPVFLVIEVEQPEGLSTRKLVLETAKYNVMTAYSGKEGLDIFAQHPVDAVVVHNGIRDMKCDEVAARIKRERPDMPVIALAANETAACGAADTVLTSHDPGLLLEKLQQILKDGKPKTRRPGIKSD